MCRWSPSLVTDCRQEIEEAGASLGNFAKPLTTKDAMETLETKGGHRFSSGEKAIRADCADKTARKSGGRFTYSSDRSIPESDTSACKRSTFPRQWRERSATDWQRRSG